MKNAMKKLMSLLLVAVLLVSAVPFQASAAETSELHVIIVDPQGRTSGFASNEYIVCTTVDGKIVESDRQAVASAISGKGIIAWNYNGSQYSSLKDINHTGGATNVYPVFPEVATITFYVNYGNGTSKQFSLKDGETLGTAVLPTDIANPGYTLKGYFLADGTQVNAGWQAWSGLNGQTITASWKQVGCVECGQTSGHLDNCSQNPNKEEPKDETTGTQPTAASYVDVILVTNKTSGFTDKEYYRCYLSNGKITQAQRDYVASQISGKNIVAWTANGTQKSSLLDFDFSNLTNPINVYPIVGTTSTNKEYKVAFVQADGSDLWSLTVKEGMSIANPGYTYNTTYKYAEQNVKVPSGKKLLGWGTSANATSYDSMSNIVSKGVFANATYYPVFGTTSGGNNGNSNTDTCTVKFYLDANNAGTWTVNVPVGSTVSADEVANAAYRVATASGYTFAGWRKNGTGDTLTTNNVTQVAITGDTYFTPVFNKNVSNKFPYPVYLNIYKDTMVGSPDKRVEITSGIALDGIVSLSEVKTVVANYYNAKNSYGIGFDGLYLAKGNWVSDYINDSNKYNTINADELRQTGTVYINVMISNAVAKTSSTADSSNPKTGDEIYIAVTALGLSGAALASALYVFTKKRTAK